MHKKKQYIKDLKVGDIVYDCFAVCAKKDVVKYSNGFRFELTISDRTGAIPYKYWGGQNEADVRQLQSSVRINDIVMVKGKVSQFNGNKDISANDKDLLTILSAQECDLSDFVKKTDKNIDEMFGYIKQVIGSVKEPHMEALLSAFFSDAKFVDDFKNSPAAKINHQSWIGGLLEHTYNVLNICLNTCQIYPSIDKELIITGALLHDIGKIHAYQINAVISQTERGILEGHIVMGAQMFEQKCANLDMPMGLKTKLLHIILSHHGKLEYGSPVAPAFPEAMLVHKADELDSCIASMVETKDGAGEAGEAGEGSFAYNKNYGYIFLK